MGAISFRRAAAADVTGVHALVESAYRGESATRGWTHEADLLGGQRTDEAALQEIIADATQIILLAVRDERLVGCVLIADKGERGGGRTAYLGMLTVRPELQGQGLGHALMDEAERCAREIFDAAIMEMTVISVRDELIAWYERHGYRRTGRQEPFPNDPRFGVPKVNGLVFDVLAKRIA